MSSRSSPFGYSLFDFFTRVIPGLAVVLPFVIGYLLFGPRIDVGFQPTLIGLAIIGLVFGEVIDLIRSSVFRVPLPFKQVIYSHTRIEGSLSWFDQLDLRLQKALPEFLKFGFLTGDHGRGTIFDEAGENFQDEYESHFRLKFNDAKALLIYSTLLSYMDTRMSSQTRRYYMLRIFSQNLMFAAIFTTINALVITFLRFGSDLITVVAGLTILILVFVFELGLMLSPVAYTFIDRLIIDYYVDRLE